MFCNHIFLVFILEMSSLQTLQYFQVNVIAQSSLNASIRASRLLRIVVEDDDDNEPQFAPHTPLAQRVFAVDRSKATAGDFELGRVRAFDEDAAPFDRIHYRWLSSCESAVAEWRLSTLAAALGNANSSSQLLLDAQRGEMRIRDASRTPTVSRHCILAT